MDYGLHSTQRSRESQLVRSRYRYTSSVQITPLIMQSLRSELRLIPRNGNTFSGYANGLESLQSKEMVSSEIVCPNP